MRVLAFLLMLTTVSVASATPCTRAAALTDGDQAQCDGILWPEPWSRSALACLSVDLPAVKKEMELKEQQCSTLRALDARRIRFLEQEAAKPVVVEKPEVDWLWVGAAGATGLVVGALGALLIVNL